MHRESIAQLVAALGPDNVRFVGGAVRDSLLDLPVKDIDMATVHRPETVVTLLNQTAIRNIPTGIEHGTITAVLADGPVEITTLRHDVSTDGRHATVAFATDWQEDAARRDFTINALYAHPLTGEVFDWFGGLTDLEKRHVRFIGDAAQRIREDHLRILRYFRFQARFGSTPADTIAENACKDLAATLKGLSRERVGMEVMNLLSLSNPAPTVKRMEELGILAVILPEANPEGLTALIEAESKQGHIPDPIRRLAALLPAQVPLAEQVASRFRLSGAQKKRLALAAARDSLPGEARGLAYRIGLAPALDRLLIAGADASALIDWEIPQFPIKGGQIVAKGVSAGPQVAKTLRRAEDLWIAQGFPSADEMDGILDQALSEISE